MFERYTAKARRVIFMARYEVSQLGADAIGTEHLLLGLLREEKSLLSRFFPARPSIDDIRKQVEGRVAVREKIPTSLEVPLSVGAKNVLRRGAEEADSLSHRGIKPEHLFLGLLKEEGSLGAEVLRENGVEYGAVRKELEKEVEE